MGHENVNIPGHAIILDPGQQGHIHLHPNPCLFYRSAANFPQHNIYYAVTTPGNLSSYSCHHVPEHIENASYGVLPPPYIVVQSPHPAANFDLAVASWSRHYNPYIAPLSDGLFRNANYTDDIQPIKGKSSDEAPLNQQFQNSSAGSSSSVGPVQLPGNSLFGTPGYQAPDMSRNPFGFLRPRISHPFHSTSRCPIQPTQGLRGYDINSPSHVAISSHRIAQHNSSNAGIIISFPDAVGARSTLLASIPATNFCSYWPHPREVSPDPNARQHNFPYLRVLPEDEVAILEIPSYHEGGSIDRLRDMRLDIDHMSYEELLALGEHIGSVTTGLTENFICKNLKTRTFTRPPTCINHDQASCPDQLKTDFCVVCQADYEHEETIGKLDCEHEYHGECIKKWLLVKNTCPVCKSTALSGTRTDL